jgi:hypothetical protein
MNKQELQKKIEDIMEKVYFGGINRQEAEKATMSAVSKYTEWVIGEDEKPTKVFVPDERGPTAALNADPRNELRKEQRKRGGIV